MRTNKNCSKNQLVWARCHFAGLAFRHLTEPPGLRAQMARHDASVSARPSGRLLSKPSAEWVVARKRRATCNIAAVKWETLENAVGRRHASPYAYVIADVFCQIIRKQRPRPPTSIPITLRTAGGFPSTRLSAEKILDDICVYSGLTIEPRSPRPSPQSLSCLPDRRSPRWRRFSLPFTNDRNTALRGDWTWPHWETHKAQNARACEKADRTLIDVR